eukprot:gene12291-14517_t
MSSRPSSSRQQAASGAAELARSRATAMWLDAMRVQAVKELLNISQADRATTKKEVLEERQLVVRFFSVIGAAMHDLPAELVGVTRALVDVGLFRKRRSGEIILQGALIFAFMGPHATPAVLKTWGYSCLFELFGIEGVRLLAFKTAASFLMNNIDAMIYNDNSISSWYEGHFASHMQVQYHAIAAVGSIHEVLKGLHIQGEYNSMDRLEFRYRDRKQMQEDDTVGDDYDFDIDLDMEMDA